MTVLGIMLFLQPKTSVFVEVSMIALHELRLSYTSLLLSTIIEEILVQYAKAWLPIDVTEFGIVIDVMPVFWKACWPIEVTVLGMVTNVRPVQ